MANYNSQYTGQQIDAAIGKVSTIEGEVNNIRIGADGTTYPSAGDAVRGQVFKLKQELNNINPVLFYRSGRISVPSVNIAYNYTLDGTGKCVSNNDYELLKYEVSAGDLIWVRCDNVFQFQSAKSVPSSLPNSNLIDVPITIETDGLVVVPNGATWIIISCREDDALNRGMYNYLDVISGSDYVSEKNIIGLDGNILYPIYIPSGTTITISTADGLALGQSSLNFITYNAEKGQAQFWNFSSGSASRTFTTSMDAYYVGWNTKPIKEVQAEIGNAATYYVPYALNIKSDDVIKKVLLGTKPIDTTDFKTKCTQFSSLLLGDAINNVIAPVDFETFLFFTDPHLIESTGWENRCDEMMSQIQKYYNSTPTTFCLCGGDWLGNSDLPDDACFKMGYIDGLMRSLFDKYYMLVGNHDTNYQGKKDAESERYTTRLSNQSIVDLWYRENKKAYFTFNGANTKFYCFDTGTESQALTSYNNYGWEQVIWFANSLLSDNSSHIAISGHILYNDLPTNSDVCPIMAQVLQIAKAYNVRDTITVNGTSFDYANATGKIEFCVCGHSHGDYNGVINGIPYFLTVNVRHGTGMCASFDLVMVDYDNKQIKLVRVGDGSNRTVALI